MKRLLFTLFTLLMVGTMQAQERKLRTIRLKSGIEVTGTVINEIPGQEITIQTASGDTFVYQAYEIDYNGRPDKKGYNTKYNCYRGFVKVGAGANVGCCGEFTGVVTISNGYQFSPSAYLGLGVGYLYCDCGEAIPISLNFKSHFNRGKRVAPYTDIHLGYSVDMSNEVSWCSFCGMYHSEDSESGGFYGDLEFGAAIFLNKKNAINIGAGVVVEGDIIAPLFRVGFSF